jgi:hypothetical protein
MESPLEAQKQVYGAKKGPPMIYDEMEPPTRPRKRRKLDSDKGATGLLMYSLRQNKYKFERENPDVSPCELPGDFPPELAFRALAAYSLLRTLSVQLRLSPFTPNLFLRALYLPFPNKLMGQVHVSLFRILLPQLQMGFSYKPKGGAVGAHKRRHIDNVRWPLRAGDNLTLLDSLTWPLFYDDYCHLTADRLWASMHDEQLHLDFRNAGMQDIGVNDYEVSDDEDDREPQAAPLQQWTGAPTSSMMYYPPSVPQVPQVPVSTERCSRSKERDKNARSNDHSDADSEFEAGAVVEEEEEDWKPEKQKRKRRRAKKTTPSKALGTADVKIFNPNAPQLPMATNPSIPQASTPLLPKVANTVQLKATPTPTPPKTLAPATAAKVAKSETTPAASSVPSKVTKTPRPSSKPSKVFDVESPVPGLLTDSDKALRSSSLHSMVPKEDKKKEPSGAKPHDKKSKVLEVSIATPGARFAPIPVRSEPAEKRTTTDDGSETEEEDIFHITKDADKSKTVKENQNASIPKSSDSNPSSRAGKGGARRRMLPLAQKPAKSTPAKSSPGSHVGGAVAAPTRKETTSATKLAVQSVGMGKQGDGNPPETKRPRGRPPRKLPLHSTKAKRPLSPQTSSPAQPEKKLAPELTAQQRQNNYQQQLLQQQQMMQMQQQQKMMQMQQFQMYQMQQHQMQQHMQKQHQGQHFRMQQMAMEGGLKGNFATGMNGGFGARQQQKAMSSMQGYGGAPAAQGYGMRPPSMVPSMTMKHPPRSRTCGHEKHLKGKGLEVSDDIASALQKFACGIELEKPESGEEIKDQDGGGETDSFETKLDEHRWIHFEPIKAMRSGTPYYRLPVEQKLVMLEFLIDELLQVGFISAEFSKRRAMTECYTDPYGVLPTEKEFKELENDDECAICLGEGELLCCDGCVRSWHRECLDMTKGQALPDGKWLCPECKLVDPANFGPLRGGRKASLDWFTVDDVRLAIKSNEQMKQASFPMHLGLEGTPTNNTGLTSAFVHGRSAPVPLAAGNCAPIPQQLPSGQLVAHNSIVASGLQVSQPPTSSAVCAISIPSGQLAAHNSIVASGLQVSQPPTSSAVGAINIPSGQLAAHNSIVASGLQVSQPPTSSAVGAINIPSGQLAAHNSIVASGLQVSQPPTSSAVGAINIKPSSLLVETDKVHGVGSKQPNPISGIENPRTEPVESAIVPMNQRVAPMSTRDQSANIALSNGMEFIVIHGFVFARKSSSSDDSGQEIEAKPSQLHLVLQRNEVDKYLEGMGSKISQAWPLVQIPLKDKSFGIHFPSARLYLTPLDSFDPSFYSSRYRKAPVPLFMHAGGGAHMLKLMSSDFESECAQCNTYKITDSLLRDFSFDKDIARCLRTQVTLFDPYQFFKVYMGRLETSLRKACLLSEFWEAGKEKSRHDIWEANLKKARSIGRLSELLLSLVEATHPRAFSEGWFHNPLAKHSDNADGPSDRHFVDMPADWTPDLELRKRMWERTHADMLLHLTTKDGCSLDGFVKGIRAELLEPVAVVRSKRKQLKSNGTGLDVPEHAPVSVGQMTTAPCIAGLELDDGTGGPGSAPVSKGQSNAVPPVAQQEPDSGTVLGGPASAPVTAATQNLLQASATMLLELSNTAGATLENTPAQKAQLAENTARQEPCETIDIGDAAASAAPNSNTAEKAPPPVGDQATTSTSIQVAEWNANIQNDNAEAIGGHTDNVIPRDSPEHPDSSKEVSTEETSKRGRPKKTDKKPVLSKKRSTRRSGRLTRHAAEVSPFGSPGPVSTVAANTSKLPVRSLDFEIEKHKEAKIPEIEKIVKGPLLKDVLWPIAGRLPFATLGSLPRHEMKRLARNAGVVHAPHVAYQTSHEVGQVCWAHMWRKRTEQCTGLEEFILMIRFLESFLERPVRLS